MEPDKDPDDGRLAQSAEPISTSRAIALTRQRSRRANRARIDYYPAAEVLRQILRFKAVRPSEPLQGVIDLLLMRAAAALPEGDEDALWP
jgi:hypothetical protein